MYSESYSLLRTRSAWTDSNEDTRSDSIPFAEMDTSYTPLSGRWLHPKDTRQTNGTSRVLTQRLRRT